MNSHFSTMVGMTDNVWCYKNDIIQDLKSGLINQTDIAKKYNISKSSVTLIKQKNDI